MIMYVKRIGLMKKYLSPLLKGFLSAYSLSVCFHAPLSRAFYADSADYYTASVYELLGEYSFPFFLIWALCAVIFLFLAKKGYSVNALMQKDGRRSRIPWIILSIFFGFFYTLGLYIANVGIDGPGSAVNCVKFLLCIAGFALICFPSLSFLHDKYHEFNAVKEEGSGFFSKNAFIKSFLIMGLFYLPFLILSYPGNLCYDVIGQIEQVATGSYSSHHPLLHSLFVGGMVKLGEKLFSSKEIGLFIYVVLQTALLLGAFATTIAFLAKHKVRSSILWGMLLLYLFTPIYTNLSTTAVKDIPFTAFVLFYVVMYAYILSDPELIRKPAIHLLFLLVQIGVITMRNNGLPLVALSGVAAVITLLARKVRKSTVVVAICSFLAESIILSTLLLALVGNALHASKGSRGEIFSLPFQQTAYTLSVCKDSLSEKEIASIENVLGDVNVIIESYDKDIADPVKANFRQDASTKDLIGYLTTYASVGIKHPFLYAKAFFIHTHGWYCPTVTNEIRYETEYDAIGKGMAFNNADKVLVFLYRFANRFTPLGVLENIGVAVWCLAFLTVSLRRKKAEAAISTFPLWVCFLICLASPCFYKHPRYALPILVCLPFLFVFAKLKGKEHVE
jgi:hypothetical protein